MLKHAFYCLSLSNLKSSTYIYIGYKLNNIKQHLNLSMSLKCLHLVFIVSLILNKSKSQILSDIYWDLNIYWLGLIKVTQTLYRF